MASYTELHETQSNNALQNKVRVACVIAADTIRSEDVGIGNHANRLLWAAAVLTNPASEAKRMMWALLAANKDTDVAQIVDATDAQIQTAVDAAIILFATG